MKINGHWLVILAAMLWGTTGTAQALAPNEATPLVVGALRLVVGGVALLFIARIQGKLLTGARWSPLALTFAVMGVALYQVTFFGGVARTGVAVGTIVGIGSAPVIAGLLAFVVRGERLSSRWFVATALAVSGCALLALSGEDVGVDPLGILLSLGAGVSYAVYTIASKSLVEQHPPETVMAVIFCLGALILSPLLLTGDLNWVITPNGLAVTLHLGLIATGLAYVFFARGLRTVGSAVAVTLTLAEPLTAGLLGVIVVGETLTSGALLGIALLFCGLAMLTIRRPSVRYLKRL